MSAEEERARLEQEWQEKLAHLKVSYTRLTFVDGQELARVRSEALELEGALDELEASIIQLAVQARTDAFLGALRSLDYKTQKDHHQQVLHGCVQTRVACCHLHGTRERGLYWLGKRLIGKLPHQSPAPFELRFDFGAPVKTERAAVLHHLSRQLKPGLAPVAEAKRLKCFVDLLAKKLQTSSVIVVFDQLNKLPANVSSMPETVWTEVAAELSTAYPKRPGISWAFALFLFHETAPVSTAAPSARLPLRFEKKILESWLHGIESPPTSLDDAALDAILEQTGGVPEDVVQKLGIHFACDDCDPAISDWWTHT